MATEGNSSEITVLPEPSGINPHTLTVLENKPFFHGGGKPKHKITAEMKNQEGDRSKRISLVERDFGGDTDKIVEVYEKCKKAGVPVVDTFRKTTDGKIVMTDVEADGSRIYGKAVSLHSKGANGETRKPDPLDKVFLALVNDDEVVKEIEAEAQRIAVLAGKNGIMLADDDRFELIVHPNKTWNLLCLDLEWTKIFPNTPEKNLIDGNLQGVSSFGINLQRARMIFSSQSTFGIEMKSVFDIGSRHDDIRPKPAGNVVVVPTPSFQFEFDKLLKLNPLEIGGLPNLDMKIGPLTPDNRLSQKEIGDLLALDRVDISNIDMESIKVVLLEEIENTKRAIVGAGDFTKRETGYLRKLTNIIKWVNDGKYSLLGKYYLEGARSIYQTALADWLTITQCATVGQSKYLELVVQDFKAYSHRMDFFLKLAKFFAGLIKDKRA